MEMRPARLERLSTRRTIDAAYFLPLLGIGIGIGFFDFERTSDHLPS
jgi:hypothetical protein